MLADRRDHVPMPAFLPLHAHGGDRVRRRHQRQNMEKEPENGANDDQDQVQNAPEKGCPFSHKPISGSNAART
jgi:hypothetical protein